MKHSVFICEDYKIQKNSNGSILIMEGASEIGKVDSIELFNELATISSHNAIVCPDLMVDEDGDKLNAFIFS